MMKVALVIPTINSRHDYLQLAVESIMNQKGSFDRELVILCPSKTAPGLRKTYPQARVIEESPEGGLAQKLSEALLAAAESSDLVGWLGDDDLLFEGTIEKSLEVFARDAEIVMTYGGCEYIDASGRPLFLNRSGKWAAKLLRFGPQLIPQPGSLMRSDAFLRTKGLRDQFGLAFDFDLFIRLSKLGKLAYLNSKVSSFRWHPDSLSVKRRLRSAIEASRVRWANYPTPLRPIALLWEPIVIAATWLAGKLVSIKARRHSDS